MTENIEYKVTWNDVNTRAQERPNIALAVDDEADQRDLVSTALDEMQTFFGNNEYYQTLTTLGFDIMAEQTQVDGRSAIFVASTHEAGLHAALKLKEAGAAPTALVYDINIMGTQTTNPMNGIEAALDVVALTNGNAPVVFFTAYASQDYTGFDSAQRSRGLYYIVQKTEGTERLKEVVRDAQYCANIKITLDSVKFEKEVYLARLRTEIVDALHEKTNNASANKIESMSTELEALCDQMGACETFSAESIHTSMKDTLRVLETVTVSSDLHPLGSSAEDQSAIDQKVGAVRQNIGKIRAALREGRYEDVQGLARYSHSSADADPGFYDMMAGEEWDTTPRRTMVLGGYLIDALTQKAPGGITIQQEASMIETLSYRQSALDGIISGLQMLLVAGERALRETGAKTPEKQVRVQVDTLYFGKTLRLNFHFNAPYKQGLEEELQRQLGFKELGPRLLAMPYRGASVEMPRIQESYSPSGPVGLTIKVELNQNALMI